ncbi:MAG: hypothetical protein LM585_01545 [Fervidicoccaceae archaeon]|jgi:hypothetical protein|uniref:Uncharacterized protein n=1 Tax=Fervidicoccus fontis TaxID=683846 RepID=A0A7C1E9H1_9CREN|nr:hypothetical protein [Fervidicoccaceae archaeon]
MRALLFNAILPLGYGLIVMGLGFLGESRLDAYLSLLTLWYFVLYLIIRPPRRTYDLLGLGLLAMFFYFVTLRILSIIFT